eukprot:1621847-Prymnesium_polylepis.1
MEASALMDLEDELALRLAQLHAHAWQPLASSAPSANKGRGGGGGGGKKAACPHAAGAVPPVR